LTIPSLTLPLIQDPPLAIFIDELDRCHLAPAAIVCRGSGLISAAVTHLARPGLVPVVLDMSRPPWNFTSRRCQQCCKGISRAEGANTQPAGPAQRLATPFAPDLNSGQHFDVEDQLTPPRYSTGLSARLRIAILGRFVSGLSVGLQSFPPGHAGARGGARALNQSGRGDEASVLPFAGSDVRQSAPCRASAVGSLTHRKHARRFHHRCCLTAPSGAITLPIPRPLDALKS